MGNWFAKLYYAILFQRGEEREGFFVRYLAELFLWLVVRSEYEKVYVPVGLQSNTIDGFLCCSNS